MMKMVHTCYRVQNLEASLDFYQKAFGFQEKRRRDFPDYKFTLSYLTLPGDPSLALIFSPKLKRMP